MTTWPITLSNPWFKYVKEGCKIYEGRCNWKQAAKYKNGDFLHISHYTDLDKESYIVKIKAIHDFESFESALRILPLNQVLPGVDSIDEGIKIYTKYVSLETQNRQGVRMIELELIS